MAKKMTLKQMEEMTNAQLAEMQAQLDALKAQLADADARVLAAETKEKEAKDRLLKELSKSDEAQFDADIRPVFDFRHYAIPGGDFAKEKTVTVNENVSSDVTVNIDELFTYEVHNRSEEKADYVITHPNIYVFTPDGDVKIRAYFRPTHVAELAYPHTKVHQFPEAGMRYEDKEVPQTVGYLRMNILSDEEVGKLVMNKFKAMHYQKPQYTFQICAPKYDANKLPKVGAPKRTTGAGTAFGAKKRTTKATQAADIDTVLAELTAAGLTAEHYRRRDFKVTFEGVTWRVTAHASGGYTHYKGATRMGEYNTAADIKWAMVR